MAQVGSPEESKVERLVRAGRRQWRRENIGIRVAEPREFLKTPIPSKAPWPRAEMRPQLLWEDTPVHHPFPIKGCLFKRKRGLGCQRHQNQSGALGAGHANPPPQPSSPNPFSPTFSPTPLPNPPPHQPSPRPSFPTLLPNLLQD